MATKTVPVNLINGHHTRNNDTNTNASQPHNYSQIGLFSLVFVNASHVPSPTTQPTDNQHERWNGNGYNGLAQWLICLSWKIR